MSNEQQPPYIAETDQDELKAEEVLTIATAFYLGGFAKKYRSPLEESFKPSELTVLFVGNCAVPVYIIAPTDRVNRGEISIVNGSTRYKLDIKADDPALINDSPTWGDMPFREYAHTIFELNSPHLPKTTNQTPYEQMHATYYGPSSDSYPELQHTQLFPALAKDGTPARGIDGKDTSVEYVVIFAGCVGSLEKNEVAPNHEISLGFAVMPETSNQQEIL